MVHLAVPAMIPAGLLSYKNMDKKLKGSVGWWILALVVIVIGIMLVKGSGTDENLVSQTTPTSSPSSSPVSGRTGSSAPKSNLTYEQALQQYGNWKIQFNDICQASIGQMAVKKGTKVLLDNRSNIPKVIKFSGSTISLPAFGWQVITATTNEPLPYSLTMDCQSSNGSSINGVILRIQANILQGL